MWCMKQPVCNLQSPVVTASLLASSGTNSRVSFEKKACDYLKRDVGPY